MASADPYALIGQSIKRVEDDRLLRGHGRFLADLRVPGTLEAVFVRSPHAHATILRVDVTGAGRAAGVRLVLTAAEVAPRTVPICVSGEVHTPQKLIDALHPVDRLHPIPLLPTERVTYVGQPVVVVVAETRAAALDAAELVQIEYRVLPSVVDADRAIETGAPLVEPKWGTNVALSVATGKGDVERAFAQAAVVVEEEFRTHRYVAASIEPRGIQVSVEPIGGALTVWASTQTPHVLQTILASTLKMSTEQIRVIACDVGGGFGLKGVQCPEEGLVALAARDIGETVRWVEERGENLVAAPHARDQIHRISAAATRDGRIIGLRNDVLVNFGAFNVIGLVVPYNTLSHLLGTYDVPNAHISVQGILTNTSPTTPYRGAGRPEAVFAMERIVDRVAAKLGLEPADVRARNLVGANAMPYDTGLLYRDGHPQVYDSGDFPELLRRARALVDLDGVRAKQKNLKAGERAIGVGFAMYVEGSGMGPFEGAVVRVLPSGRVQVATGACSQGQGHRTVYAQIAADALGVPFSSIDVIGGDTATIAYGIGTIASRSTVTAGNAIHRAAGQLKARIVEIGADMLEAAAADLEVVDGQVRIAGIPGRAVPVAQVAQAAAKSVLKLGQRGDALLAETAYFVPPTVTYASAAHAVVVSVDTETGEVTLERYVVVHDCGRVVNPLLADAQVIGGVVQGIGGILREELVYDERGQPLSGTFLDYAMPIASDVPSNIVLDHIESLSTRNPLGVKGLGEGGAIGPPAAIANAVEDALKSFGVVVRRGPLSASRVRRMIDSSVANGGVVAAVSPAPSTVVLMSAPGAGLRESITLGVQNTLNQQLIEMRTTIDATLQGVAAMRAQLQGSNLRDQILRNLGR